MGLRQVGTGRDAAGGLRPVTPTPAAQRDTVMPLLLAILFDAGEDEALETASQRKLEELEGAHALQQTGEPDGGLAWAVHRWASGRRLDEVLSGSELTAGDFVRRCKQVVDLLDQVADAAPEPHLRGVARTAVDKVMRGVVAADRLD